MAIAATRAGHHTDHADSERDIEEHTDERPVRIE
jgi:hypothetical protein